MDPTPVRKCRAVRTVLLDIEGTTSSISFVHEVMFGYVRTHLDSFLGQHLESEALQPVLRQLAIDAELDPENWLPKEVQLKRQAVTSHVIGCMDRDQKTTGLKSLQGMIWKDGFASGALKAHLFPEVAPQLHTWKSQGLDLRIYSSGSKKAQILFFGHTLEGNLLPLFSAHYDTTIGGKKQADSYRKIAEEIGSPADTILFLSDLYDELVAASEAGMQVMASVRPGNAPLPPNCPFETFGSLKEIALERLAQ